MKTFRLHTTLAVAALLAASLLRAEDAAAPKAENAAGSGRTVRLLTVGNSFAGNSCSYIKQIAEAAGNRVVLGQANPGGCPLEKHWGMAQRHEKDPKDADLEEWVRLVYEQALIAEGQMVPDPLAYSKRVNNLLLKVSSS